jgi:predicted aspartyl protease
MEKTLIVKLLAKVFYAGTVFFDDQEFAIEVIGGNEFTHILMGLQWLKHRRLIVNRKMDFLTLENVS